MLNTGQPVTTGWATAGEGLLFDDKNDTGVIQSDADLVAGFSVLDGMDSNGDGKLDANDSEWQNLKVWIDPNGSGQFNSADLYTLNQLGITSINLNATSEQTNNNNNTIVVQTVPSYG